METIAKLQERLAPFYISDDIVEYVEDAGCEVQGVRYFGALFSEEDSSLEDRLTSAYLGATALGRESEQELSHQALYGMQTMLSVNQHFIRVINTAIKAERRVPNWTHVRRLEEANKLLGKPPHKRILGELASGFLQHASWT